MSKQACLNIPGVNSSASQWVSWHKALKSCVGKKKANYLFILQYDKVGYDSTTEMRNYMKTQGVDLDKDVADRLVDWGGRTYDFFGGIVDFTSGVSMVVTVMVLGAVGMLLFQIGKNPDTAVRVGSAVATRGMSEAGRGVGGGQKSIGTKAK